ncbi:MAG: hypothetical protein WCZ23_09165 [Rhodospirillaceae bacterium]
MKVTRENAVPATVEATLPPATIDSATQRYRALRLRRTRNLVIQALLFVALPTLLGALYFGLIATPRYVSEAKAKIEKSRGIATESLFSSVLGGSSGSGYVEVLKEYILSQQMVSDLSRLMDLRATFGVPEADWLSRADDDATAEEFLDYFRDRVHVSVDNRSGVLTLEVEAFTPAEAQLIGKNIMGLSEDLVNRMSKDTRDDAVENAKRDLQAAEERLTDLRLRMAELRTRTGQVDPGRSAAAMDDVVAGLQVELSKAEAELTNLLTYMRPDAPQVVALRARAGALQKQVEAEQRRVAAAGKGAVTQSLSEYEALRIEAEFAQEAYVATAANLEAARAEARRKQMYLVAFVQPNLPDEATRPDPVMGTLTVFCIALLSFGIVRLVVTALRENLQA